MKRLLTLLLAVTLLFSPALAEEAASPAGIPGSDVDAMLAALAEFGIAAPNPVEADGVRTWDSQSRFSSSDLGDYKITANADGEIISASFHMDDKNTGLFDAVAGMHYENADPERTSRFVHGHIERDGAIVIGGVKFDVRKEASTASSSIIINGYVLSSVSSTITDYYLDIGLTDEPDTEEGATMIAVVKRKVNVRGEPNTVCKSAGTVERGDEVTVLEAYYKPKWHQILYNDEIAYIPADDCELIEE